MKRFKNILYVDETGVAAASSLARAASLARNNQARLTVIDVVREVSAGIGMPAGGPISADLTAAVVAKRREALEASVAGHRGGLAVAVEVLVGRKFLEVIGKVIRDGCDLVIKPAEDPSWLDRLFGSEDMHLLRKCPCPVWLIKPGEPSNYRHILAAVGFEPEEREPDEDALNQLILELASSLALSDFADLHLVHVWDAPEAGFASMFSDNADAAEKRFVESTRLRHKAGMDQLTRRLREHIGKGAYDYLAPRVHLPRGLAAREIPALVDHIQADLVVMGTVGRTGIPGLFIGNTAETILYGLQSSVLAIKPPGFVSPVAPA
jgi:nucleotide-binding universal stress UspA family protein